MLQIRSRPLARRERTRTESLPPRAGMALADPGTLAAYVRQAIVTAASGEAPPGAS